MRGKVVKKFPWCAPIGITPAYAGKRGYDKFTEIGYRDHPRLCGEKYTRSLPYLVQRGSPPPMRGKGQKKACPAPGARITPAYAGKSIVNIVQIISL